jgi:hypothetical protein
LSNVTVPPLPKVVSRSPLVSSRADRKNTQFPQPGVKYHITGSVGNANVQFLGTYQGGGQYNARFVDKPQEEKEPLKVGSDRVNPGNESIKIRATRKIGPRLSFPLNYYNGSTDSKDVSRFLNPYNCAVLNTIIP